jgi:glutathione peroxidase
MTVGQYTQLNQLYSLLNPSGFEILAFPCAQFNNQEPGVGDEILDCLQYVRPGGGFQPLFPLFNKIDVNGASISSVYTWLKDRCPNPQSMVAFDNELVMWSPIMYNDISWNFEKFLIDRSGNVYKRYNPVTYPLMLQSDVQDLLDTTGY